MGKLSRDKGARFERQIANRLKEVFGPRTIRSSGQCFSGDTRADVDCPKIWVECKVGKRPNIKAALEQAEEAGANAGTDKTPVAICKWDRESPIVSMRLDAFIELLKLAMGDRYNVVTDNGVRSSTLSEGRRDSEEED